MGTDLQQRSLSGQSTFRLELGHHGNRRPALDWRLRCGRRSLLLFVLFFFFILCCRLSLGCLQRVGRLHLPIDFGLQAHRAGALQHQVGVIAAISPLHIVHCQLVFAAVIAVVALESLDQCLRRALPDDAIDLKRHIKLQRQCQLLQRLGRRFVRIRCAGNLQLSNMHLAQLQLA